MDKNALILVNKQVLEDWIVKCFSLYEKGLWPISMRHEARNIIEASRPKIDS